MIRYVIEDDFHAELFDQFPTLDLAIQELKRLAGIPWDQPPNQAPCENWKGCGRTYHILEVDAAKLPWKERRRLPMLEISAKGVQWSAAGLKARDSRPRS